MKHLTLKRDGRYSYYSQERPADEGVTVNAVSVEVYYSKGGMNMFSGNGEPRGIWLCITPASLTSRGTSLVLGDSRGTRAHLVTLKAKSDKRLIEVAEKLDALIPEAAKLAASDGGKAAVPMLRKALEAVS